MLAAQADGRNVVTIEGLATRQGLHPLQQVFEENGALQCGFCGPGVILTAKALLDENPHPTTQEIRTALAGNLCRCTGYAKMIEGIHEAATMMKAPKAPQPPKVTALAAPAREVSKQHG